MGFSAGVAIYSVIVFLLTAYWQHFLFPAAFPSQGSLLDATFGLPDA